MDRLPVFWESEDDGQGNWDEDVAEEPATTLLSIGF